MAKKRSSSAPGSILSGRELDLKMAEILGFSKAKYFKNGAGSCPEDAVIIDDKPGKEWSTTCKGGTYPYILESGTIFRAKGAYGEEWAPSKNIMQAFEVVNHLVEEGWFFRLQCDNPEWTYAEFFRANEPGYEDSRQESRKEGTALAICRAALLAMKKKS